MSTKHSRRRSSNLTRYRKSVSEDLATRRAHVADVDAIKKLYTDSTYKLFGQVEIEDLIHLCYITLVLEDQKNILAAISVNNYPNIPSIPPWDWHSWMANKYRMERCNPRNTLWVHLAVFDKTHKFDFMIPLLSALFAKCPYVQFVLLVIPPGLFANLEWLEKLGMELLPYGFDNSLVIQSLYVIIRQHYTLNYKIRQAVAEDNDDLVSLINTHSKTLKSMYGDFYIAEIILKRDVHCDRHLIVAEYNGEAVAVLCLNRHLNYKAATECFQLITFYALKKPHTKDSLHLSKSNATDINDGDVSLYSFVFNCSDDQCSIETSTSEQGDDTVIDLNKTLETISILSEEVYEEEESEEEFFAFRGHANPDISYDALEFTEKQLESWRKIRRRSIAVDYEDETSATFNGPENAFAMEIAAARPEHEAALSQLLEASFELFPKRDYCIMSIPSQSHNFPLATKVFVRAAPKPESDFSQELYIVHHSAISGYLQVREATYNDYGIVRKFLRKITKGDSVMEEFQAWMDSEYEIYKTYLLFCDNRIIGLAILSDVDDLEYIISHYQLATWTDMSKHKLGSRGCIIHFVLSPIFHRHSRFFLLELHRLSDYSILFYIIRPMDVEVTSSKALCCVLGDLIPVIPSKIPEYCTVSASSWNLPEAVGRVERPYAIYISTPVFCGLTRQEINDKIIVVGASDVGIAFLVGLIFHSTQNIRVTFNNIILVSTHGLVPYRSNRFRDIMTPNTSEVSGYYLSLLSLCTYVTVITGVMSAIDRKNKSILVNGTSLSYDLLFLTCGKQYQMPKRAEDKRGKTVERPNNVFIVNTETDIDIVIKTLKELVTNDHPGHIIVYGYTLDAYCCVEAVIELGVPFNRVYFILPPRTTEDPYVHNTIFNDNDVEDAVNDKIKKLGIQMYVDYEFVDWTFDDKNHNIISIRFESKTRLLDVDCMAVFMYEKKRISTKTFKAVTNCNLIFDGGVVVDNNCCTNDPNIYAAGTISKYSRRYYAEHMKQCYYNRTEIGNTLGHYILNKLMRGSSPSEDSENIFTNCRPEGKKLVPRYTQPLSVFARLPGKINYMSVKKPGVECPLEVAMTADDYGQVLTSGDCKNLDKQGYFRLHLNQYNTVETITCLTTKLTSSQFHDQHTKFNGSEYQKKVTEKVLEFLIDNYNYLPMYANPMAVNVILAGYEVSPMFNNT
ncbi:cilia- and flagella-associated protein 61 [Holotrichia oblita]|uniref:Cilia- and flagella-associated protein 61 n=1 Tax=Holotrichia oblita TaxID=644536 RepID=A0ACB9SR83_HOLOL|nr:cilia- and flagella-associated protein 61 [Holotrichia oblita]